MKNNVAYQVFIDGKGSSRPQHLQFNDDWQKFLWIACPVASLSAGVAAIHQGVDLGFLWELWLVPPLFRFHEIWATPDNDECHKVKGFRGFYWTPYARKFKHRSLWSHTLTFGTPLRFCIAYWAPILAFTLGWNWQVLYSYWGNYSFGMLSEFTFPMFAVIFLAYWYVAALMSDLCHLILDRYNHIEWFVGKK